MRFVLYTVDYLISIHKTIEASVELFFLINVTLHLLYCTAYAIQYMSDLHIMFTSINYDSSPMTGDWRFELVSS